MPDLGPSKPRRSAPLGWWLALSAMVGLLVALRLLLPLFRSPGPRPIGDGRNPDTYGFDLSNCLVPKDEIVASGLPKGGLRALDRPPIWQLAQVDSLRGKRRGKYLVSTDRIVGVVLRGNARAYPLAVLNWHEVVNDTLGGVPIAVTYSPLADAVVVFDRRTEGGMLHFGVSGLLYNSNLLFFDQRSDPASESLWSQLQARAVTGPAAREGRELRVLSCSLVRWEDWRTRHPETTVLARDPEFAERYARNPYASYFGDERLRFPVRPLPPEDGWPYKTRLVVVGAGGERRIFPLPVLTARAGTSGRFETVVGTRPVILLVRDDPPTVSILPEDAEDGLEVFHSFWFAWYALRPGDRVLEGDAPR